jgi:hypothetical protein
MLVLYNAFGCTTGCISVSSIIVDVLSELPILMFNGYIILWYIVALFCHFISPKTRGILRRQTRQHYKVVKHLFKKRKDAPLEGCRLILKTIISSIYNYNSSFRFPLRFLIAMVMSIVILYQLFIAALSASIDLGIYLMAIRDSLMTIELNLIIKFSESTNEKFFGRNITKLAITYIPVVADSFVGPSLTIPLAVIVSTVICYMLILSLFRSVSHDLQRLKRGERPVSFKSSLHSLLVFYHANNPLFIYVMLLIIAGFCSLPWLPGGLYYF